MIYVIVGIFFFCVAVAYAFFAYLVVTRRSRLSTRRSLRSGHDETYANGFYLIDTVEKTAKFYRNWDEVEKNE